MYKIEKSMKCNIYVLYKDTYKWSRWWNYYFGSPIWEEIASPIFSSKEGAENYLQNLILKKQNESPSYYNDKGERIDYAE